MHKKSITHEFKEKALEAYVYEVERRLSDGRGMTDSVYELFENYYSSRDNAEKSGVNVKFYDDQISKLMRRHLRA
ncbi:MAG: hypothetical protein Q7S56_02300 [Nanoarchaeota archaeon]|nr:hypothetical protein [Nanoarchaeota archaeon]